VLNTGLTYLLDVRVRLSRYYVITENAANKYLASTVGSLYPAVRFGQLRMYIKHWAQTSQRVCSAQQQQRPPVLYRSAWNSPDEVLGDRHPGSSIILQVRHVSRKNCLASHSGICSRFHANGRRICGNYIQLSAQQHLSIFKSPQTDLWMSNCVSGKRKVFISMQCEVTWSLITGPFILHSCNNNKGLQAEILKVASYCMSLLH
jgi:hypothetical protein